MLSQADDKGQREGEVGRIMCWFFFLQLQRLEIIPLSYFHSRPNWPSLWLVPLKVCKQQLRRSGQHLIHLSLGGCFPSETFSFAYIHKLWPDYIKYYYLEWAKTQNSEIKYINICEVSNSLQMFSDKNYFMELVSILRSKAAEIF